MVRFLLAARLRRQQLEGHVCLGGFRNLGHSNAYKVWGFRRYKSQQRDSSTLDTFIGVPVPIRTYLNPLTHVDSIWEPPQYPRTTLNLTLLGKSAAVVTILEVWCAQSPGTDHQCLCRGQCPGRNQNLGRNVSSSPDSSPKYWFYRALTSN